MAFGLDAALGLVGGVKGIIDSFGASRRLKEAQEARDRMLNTIGSDLQRRYQETQQGNLQALRRNTGMLGDSLNAQGSDMGSALARAGVTNSSATAGALTKTEQQNATALQGQATQNFQSEEALLGSQQDRLNNLRLGVNQFGNPNGQGIYGDIANAQAQAGSAWNGVQQAAVGLQGVLGSKAPAAAVPGTSGGVVGSAVPWNPFGPQAGTSGGALGGTTVPGVPSVGNPLGGLHFPDPTQSNIQTRAAGMGVGVGSPGVQLANPRINGPMMNGNQGTAFPNPYRRLFP